ncbi:MAG: EAL domain-containing response regulator [Rhizobiales bacterium]|nr:EAL domain-containing response regulator [Hyphomicrobiales bacterium]
MKVGTNILVVDDDPIVRGILESYFTYEHNADVVVTENGLRALTVLIESPKKFELILCDLNMPEMDGVQFLRHINELGYDGQLAVISGEDTSVLNVTRDIASFYSFDLIGILTKPLDTQKLAQLAAAALPSAPRPKYAEQFQPTPQSLQDAIGQHQIVPFYQPKIDIHTGKVTGAEALARWIDPELGIIQPAQFIDAAQATGQMRALSGSLLKQAINSCAQWHASGLPLKVAINLTPDIFEWLEFPDELAARVDATGLDRSAVTLEITESSFLKQNTTVLEVLARLRIQGFDLAIDDFGTGFSNIEQLRKFPFSQLKIDQSFVRNAAKDRFARASVEASVHLGRELNMRIVAEGVEDQDDWDFVAQCGVDEVQGFYVAKPMPEEEFFEWVHRTSAARYHAEQQVADAVSNCEQEEREPASLPPETDEQAATNRSEENWKNHKSA